MKPQPKRRARRGAQFQYEEVPDVLIKVGLYLPMDVHMRDLEWSRVERTLAEKLLVNPPALRRFLAEQQRIADEFKANQRRQPSFAEYSGALSGGAL